MIALKLTDIRTWLIDNRDEYRRLKAQEFPPFDNGVYSMYNHLYEFIKYYPYTHKCEKALQDLKAFLNYDFYQIIKWTQTNEVLGSQQLLMFEVNYIGWNENVTEEFLKIHTGLYTERRPFAYIICFCKIFQLLYWDNSIHETNLTESEQLVIYRDLQNIFDKYYIDKLHE